MSLLGNSELTPEQKRIPQIFLTRGMQEVFGGFSLKAKWRAPGLREHIRHRVWSVGRKGEEPIVFLSAGCGSGQDINQITDHLRITNRDIRHRIIGLGLDLNPVPGLAYDIDLPFEEVERPNLNVPAREAIQLIRGDVTDMHMIPDESVDGLWLCGVLAYVRDKLAALEEIHRVLKPGGFGFASTAEWALTHPHLQQIIEETRGGEDFCIFHDPNEYQIRGGFNIVGCHKPEDPTNNKFEGFRRRFLQAHPSPSARPIVAGSHAELFCYSEYA